MAAENGQKKIFFAFFLVEPKYIYMPKMKFLGKSKKMKKKLYKGGPSP